MAVKNWFSEVLATEIFRVEKIRGFQPVRQRNDSTAVKPPGALRVKVSSSGAVCVMVVAVLRASARCDQAISRRRIFRRVDSNVKTEARIDSSCALPAGVPPCFPSDKNQIRRRGAAQIIPAATARNPGEFGKSPASRKSPAGSRMSCTDGEDEGETAPGDFVVIRHQREQNPSAGCWKFLPSETGQVGAELPDGVDRVRNRNSNKG